MDSSHFFINYFLFICTVISFFYYLRLIKIIYFDTPDSTGLNIDVINFATVYGTESFIQNGYRFWLMSISIIILGSYIFIMQKPRLILSLDVLSSLF
jgi:NADH:ubiquinone oxidoreductase subunit 2 (subunit N)